MKIQKVFFPQTEFNSAFAGTRFSGSSEKDT